MESLIKQLPIFLDNFSPGDGWMEIQIQTKRNHLKSSEARRTSPTQIFNAIKIDVASLLLSSNEILAKKC